MSEKNCKNCKYNDTHVNEYPCNLCMREGYPEKKIKWEVKKK